MDWMTLSDGLGVPCLSLFPLGTLYKNSYYISDDCLTCLNEINVKINCEDPSTRPLRRALIFLDVLNKDLIPILIHIKKQPCIFRSAVKLLVWLTLPVGCLLSDNTALTQDAKPNNYIAHELTQFLHNAKEAFLNPVVTRTILDHLNIFLAKQSLSLDECDCVNFLLLLIRNILHAPERPPPNLSVDNESTSTAAVSFAFINNSHTTTDCSQQNLLLKDLFGQGLDRLLINLLATSQKRYWVVTIAQLIALFYKDQQVESLEKLLNKWINASCSSILYEDINDSATLQQIDNPCDSSHILDVPSDPVFIVLAGTAEKVDQTKSSIKRNASTTTNNESPQTNRERKQMPHLINEFSELTGKHNHKKEREAHFLPKATQNEISQLLKEFSVYFLLNGYNSLISQLYLQLSEQETLGKSYFLWLITYFLRFTSQMELRIKYLKDIFNPEILSYLTFEAVRKTEKFKIKSLQKAVDLKQRMRSLRLNVSAIREYLIALEKYSCPRSYQSTDNVSLCRDDKYQEQIYQMGSYLPAMHNLRQLFLLQLSLFNPSTQSRQYLCDIITANHVLLISLERATSESPYSPSFDLCQHLHQFCTKTILSRYGTALEDFKTNGHFINDCIFTMLHHIGGDLGRPDLLCDAIFLQTFSKMLSDGFNLNADWEDLIEYIMQKSKQNFQTSGRFDIDTVEHPI